MSKNNKPKKITLDLVNNDGEVVRSAELEAQPMPEGVEFVPYPMPEPTPDMSYAEGFFLRYRWLEVFKAAQERHPDYRPNEYGQWQRSDPATGQWLNDTDAQMQALVTWLEVTYPLKVRAIEHALRTWMREHDFDI